MNWKIVIAIILTGGIGYAAWRYFNKQQKLLEDYSVSLVSLNVFKWTKGEAVINFIIRLQNKSDIEATLQQFYADVYVNEILAGNVASAAKETAIPARGYSDIHAQLTFSPEIVLKNAVDIVIGIINQKDIAYRLKGYVRLSSGFVPVSIPFETSGTLKDFISVPKTI